MVEEGTKSFFKSFKKGYESKNKVELTDTEFIKIIMAKFKF